MTSTIDTDKWRKEVEEEARRICDSNFNQPSEKLHVIIHNVLLRGFVLGLETARKVYANKE